MLHLPHTFVFAFPFDIMGKRVASNTNAAAAKKAKVSPVFAEIQDALKKAEHVPDSCRAMLAAMVPACFNTKQAERTKEQATVIQWVEDALKQQMGKLTTEADTCAAKLATLEAGKAERAAEVKQAESVLAQKKEAVTMKKMALAEAAIAMGATKKLLVEKQKDQEEQDSEFIAMKKEQDGLASAFVEHFKVPLDAGEALHYVELQPFLRNLDLEESFMVSVPNSCQKTKEERGSFDNVVLESLEQALLDRATQIKDAVSNRSPESVAREVAVTTAEEQLVCDKSAQESATAELAAAQKEVELATTSLKETEEVLSSCDVEVTETDAQVRCLRVLQEGFESGPLTSFRTSKDGVLSMEVQMRAGA